MAMEQHFAIYAEQLLQPEKLLMIYIVIDA
jgi:hypothetical protein